LQPPSQHAAYFNGEADGILASAAASSSRKKSSTSKQPSLAAIDAWFDRYREEEDRSNSANDSMSDEGIGAFCAELGLAPDNAVVLVIAQAMQAADMSGFSREEFRRGMLQLKADSPAQVSWYSLMDFLMMHIR
jgi:hypothetical protein